LKDFEHPEDILNEARALGKQLLSEEIDHKPGIYELL